VPSDIKAILSLEVPIIVLLGERQLRVSEVVSLVPGAILELPKTAEEELTLMVNNKPVGNGVAVKVGENFGIRITYIGDIRKRIVALGEAQASAAASHVDEATALAEAMLAAQ
jgi:flagellar motor switch protein FliN